MKNFVIRRETPADYRAAEQLTREAFWNVYRPGCLEHYVLHQFRDRQEFVPELDLVMEADGEIVGHVMYVRAAIRTDDGREIPVMTFGPISIAPRLQHQGYGGRLLRFSVEQAKNMGAGALVITGNIGFYGKHGFVEAKSRGVRYAADPEAEYLLIAELEPGFLDGVSGVYQDPEGYFVDEGEAEVFDASFPFKEKLKDPAQLF